MSLRGAAFNPANRFEKILIERDDEIRHEDFPDVKTTFYKDTSKSILSYNDSPDIGFRASINPYRGCEHGCVYCYARPTHEYFGLSSGVDFESIIFVKTQAPFLLRKELAHPKYEPQVLAMSGITDCYQPFERKFQLSHQCLEVLRVFRNPVALITKNALITRDIDIFKDMAAYHGVSITITVTSLNSDIVRVMEPRASSVTNRLAAIETLAQAGIPVSVNVAPIIPGLTETEIPAILKACADRGAVGAGYTVVRLPFAVKDLFSQWLYVNFPLRAKKVLDRLRALHGGLLYKSEFGTRMTGQGIFAQHMADLFELGYKKAGFPKTRSHLSVASFRNPYVKQLELFNH